MNDGERIDAMRRAITEAKVDTSSWPTRLELSAEASEDGHQWTLHLVNPETGGTWMTIHPDDYLAMVNDDPDPARLGPMTMEGLQEAVGIVRVEGGVKGG